jgi:hypothetical protein
MVEAVRHTYGFAPFGALPKCPIPPLPAREFKFRGVLPNLNFLTGWSGTMPSWAEG